MFLDLRKASLALLFLSASCGAATSANSSPSLLVKVTGARSMEKSEDLKVLVSLVNAGSDAINILNHPQGPLSQLPTNTFSITDSKDATITPQFMGIRLKYSPDKAAKAGDYTTLAPGEVVTVEHDLSEAYNFTFRGSGKHEYNIAPKNVFYIVNTHLPQSKSKSTHSTTSPQITPISAKITPHVANISSSIPARRKSLLKSRLRLRRGTTNPSPGPNPSTGNSALSANSANSSNSSNHPTSHPTFVSCTSEQQRSLAAAALVAQAYVASAQTYAASLAQTSKRYGTWFGSWSASRHKTVAAQYTAIGKNDFSAYTFDCSCSDQNTFAYVYPDDYGRMYLCGAFWEAPMNGTDSKGGTIVHESSHFIKNAGGTSDIAYGQTGSELLAVLSPDSAVDNADSHEYFAENVPFLS